MSIETQYLNSGLSVTGRLGIDPSFGSPDINNAYWGYRDPLNVASPLFSQLHGEGYVNPYTYGYSVDGTPSVRLLDFNKNGFSTVKVPSTLDELDILAPKNLQIGAPSTSPGGSVVSQFYKSNPLDQYKSKGPKDGRY